MKNIIKQIANLSLYSLYDAEACNELAGPISASLHPGNTAPFEEMLQRWQAVDNTVSNLTGPRYEPQTSGSEDEHVIARPTGRSNRLICNYHKTKILNSNLEFLVFLVDLVLPENQVLLCSPFRLGHLKRQFC